MPKAEQWPLNSNTREQRGTHSHQWHPQPVQPQLCQRDPSSHLLLLANTLPLCCFLFPKLLLPHSKAVVAALQAPSPRGRSCRAAAGVQPRARDGRMLLSRSFLPDVSQTLPSTPPFSPQHSNDIIFKYASVTFPSTEYCGGRSLSALCFLVNRMGRIKTLEMHGQTTEHR